MLVILRLIISVCVCLCLLAFGMVETYGNVGMFMFNALCSGAILVTLCVEPF